MSTSPPSRLGGQCKAETRADNHKRTPTYYCVLEDGHAGPHMTIDDQDDASKGRPLPRRRWTGAPNLTDDLPVRPEVKP